MRHTTRTIALGTLAAMALLAGCSNATGGSGETAGTSSTGASASNAVTNGAPKVQSPIDTSKFLGSPCNLLTQAQLRQLGITAPGKPGQAGGDVCDWQDTSTPKHMTITAGGVKGKGLSTIYKKKPQLEVFEPLPDIDGFPAVKYAQADRSSTGGCDLAFGVSDDVAYTVSTSVNDKSEPCTTTKQVAQLVIQTLKGGS